MQLQPGDTYPTSEITQVEGIAMPASANAALLETLIFNNKTPTNHRQSSACLWRWKSASSNILQRKHLVFPQLFAYKGMLAYTRLTKELSFLWLICLPQTSPLLPMLLWISILELIGILNLVASLSLCMQQWQSHSGDQNDVLLSLGRQEINSQRNQHKKLYIRQIRPLFLYH